MTVPARGAIHRFLHPSKQQPRRNMLMSASAKGSRCTSPPAHLMPGSPGATCSGSGSELSVLEGPVSALC